MSNLRAIMVCVDYSDLLAYTLPYNRHHFSEVCVVTTPEDTDTQEVALRCDCLTYSTRTFYDGGALFNKWKALEEALNVFGRHGWLCVMDADVLWPRRVPQFPMERGYLYSPLRHMHEDLTRTWDHPWNPYYDRDSHTGLPACPITLPFPPEEEWHKFPIHRNVAEWAGYTQIFHAEDPHLGQPPWHQVDWKHAGGADSFFQQKWAPTHKVRTPFNVLHLGAPGTNWCGRATDYIGGYRHPQGEVRALRVREFLRGRVGKQGTSRFDHERLK